MAISTTIILAMLASGMGLIIFWADRKDRRNWPLALCLACIGAAFIFAQPQIIENAILCTVLSEGCIVLSILLGFEWGLRIGSTTTGKRRVAASVLLRIGQGCILVYAGLLVGYISIEPELAITDAEGLFTVRGLEWAIFAPILGSAFLFAFIAFVLMLTVRMDRAETMRLRMLWLATPFLLGGMVLHDAVIPYSVTVGLLLLIAASLQYLVTQAQRGQFMSQFLSPRVTQIVREQGMHKINSRRKQVLSVVVCDLRGFTAYARQEDSEQVVALLERFYAAVGDAAAQHDGTIKDHAGDGVLILVGAPVPVDDYADQALQLAAEIMQQGQAVLQGAGLSERVGLGVGVATGTVTVGTMRGAGHKEYVAVGNPVNLAARLCDHADDGEVLLDNRSYDELRNRERVEVLSQTPMTFKGFAAPVEYLRLL